MKFEVRGETLTVVEVRELGADNFQDFRERVRAAMLERSRNIEIDLSQTSFLDSYSPMSGDAPSSRLATGQIGRNERHRTHASDHLAVVLSHSLVNGLCRKNLVSSTVAV